MDRLRLPLFAALLASINVPASGDTTIPFSAPDLVFAEQNGLVAFEAEHFVAQTKADVRAWHITSGGRQARLKPDPDSSHHATASGGAYVELLPDTRTTHGEKMIVDQNFANIPGRLAVLSYNVHFSSAGRYYVWARVLSTGTEDNGVHFGLDGEWPASGQRWQTTQKNAWVWDNRQRTREVHSGVPLQLFLDVPSAGEHVVQVSMREDGFELDKILLTKSPYYIPEGFGPASLAKAGTVPDYSDASRAGSPGRQRDGNGVVAVEGELKQWHKVTLTVDGPFAHESDTALNPFTDYRMTVAFAHESGAPTYEVPGYFAADGNAGQTSAESGTKWRAHVSPDSPGRWNYRVEFVKGKGVAVERGGGEPVSLVHGKTGSFIVEPTDKRGRDFRAKGRLRYVGGHYLRFAGTGEYFLKAGPDSPETFLATADFDNTIALKPQVPLKTWAPHLRDWREGDPTWGEERGKGIIGAINYLAAKGLNAFSFLTYNAGGDGNNVWPFVKRDDKLHYDCSKLDQWGIVFEHAQRRGLYLHFKLQENEMDDNRKTAARISAIVPEALDGGKTGPERKLYLRELIARFGHHLALNWNLGEENTQTPEEQNAMSQFIRDIDPYDHPIVIHTFPQDQERVYRALIGDRSLLTGVSLQNSWNAAHARTYKWLIESAQAGRPWVVANDEQGSARTGVPPDPGYAGASGTAGIREETYDLHGIRKFTLWGHLLAGGAGVEYYFGYQLAENDLLAEDFRSRDRSWDYCRIALGFFEDGKIPFWEMKNMDELVGNPARENSRYCFAKPGEIYLVYLPSGRTAELDLSAANGPFTVQWFNPRRGGPLHAAPDVTGGVTTSLTAPSADDWLAVLRSVTAQLGR